MSHIGRFGRISRSIADAHEKAKPKNTKTAYRPKVTEFLQFCASLYSLEENTTHVTEERAYGFMSYHAHRKKILPKIGNQRPTPPSNGLIARIMTTLLF